GYSGWAHAPIVGNSDDLFSRFVLPLVNEMRSSELYLKLEAKGDFNNLISLTPSVKPIEGSVDHIGYQRESISILFEKSRNSSLHLRASADVGGEAEFSKDIPIIDWQDAPSLYEKVE